MFAARQPRRSPRSENVQTCQHSNVQTTLPLNSFPCHTSDNPPLKSNHCHTSKIAQNNPCSCHTSETPRGDVSCQIRIRTTGPRSVFLLPSRDEKPVTATPSKSAVTNCDARNSFRIRFYENCRVSPAFSSLFSPFAQRAFDNLSAIKRMRTLSENSRVYPKASHSGTRSLRPKPRRRSLPLLTSRLPAPTWSGSLSGSEASSSALGSFLLFSELSTFNCQPSTSSIVISLLRYLITSHVQLPHQPRNNHLPEDHRVRPEVGNDSRPR